MLSRIILVALVLAMTFLPGCNRDNGLSSDLVGHLSQQGIQIKPSRIYAPLTSRAGYVVLPYDSSLVRRIITRFSLQQIKPSDSQWQWTLDHAKVSAAKEVWGLSGRPPQFKLKNGGQLEYFYLLVTPDDQLYLLAEYAYG